MQELSPVLLKLADIMHSDDTQLELSSKTNTCGSMLLMHVSGQKHVMIEKWMTIEPSLAYIVEGE